LLLKYFGYFLDVQDMSNMQKQRISVQSKVDFDQPFKIWFGI